MAIDTKDFDSLISKLQDLITTTQSEIDADDFNLKIVALKNKADKIQNFKEQLNQAIIDKQTAIDVDAKITELQSSKDILVSKPKTPIIPSEIADVKIAL